MNEGLTRRQLVVRSGAVAGALTLYPSGALAAGPKRGGTLTIARTSEPTQFDPPASILEADVWTLDKFFEPLYITDNKGLLQPWLASGHEVSGAGRVWTFHLRQGVKFSNGKPLTSADVKWSLDRARTSKGPLSFLDGVISSIQAPNPATVVVKLKTAWAPFLSDISAFSNSILPANFAGMTEKQFFAKPIGTGPFLLDHWTKGSELTLVRNPTYWQKGKPYLDKVVFRLVPDDNTRILQLEGGQVQVAQHIPASSVKAIQSRSGVHVSLFPAWSVDLIFMNEKMKPFQDRNVRRAIAYSLDTHAITKAVVFGTARPATSFFPSSLQYFDPHVPVLGYSPAKAKQALAASSVPNGFKTEIMIPSGNLVWQSVAEIVQQSLKPIGIDVNVARKEISAFKSAFLDFKYQMMVENAINDISDPDEMASFQVDTDNGGSGSYWTNYRNPKAIALVRAAEREFNPGKRARLYSQVQAIVAQDAPYIPLYYPPYIWATSDKVHGFAVNPGGAQRLEGVWLS